MPLHSIGSNKFGLWKFTKEANMVTAYKTLFELATEVAVADYVQIIAGQPRKFIEEWTNSFRFNETADVEETRPRALRRRRHRFRLNCRV